MKEHEAILNALQQRDGAGLSHILRAHLRHKREEVLRPGFAETDGTTSRCRSREAGLPGEHSFAPFRVWPSHRFAAITAPKI
ncbi:hypothetical protein ABIF63_006175 [Bradyrhizobium japonicum]|uniref:GntR C-terminal domain-containing protein n=1 Tax=Bradyrhizobium japonicum TaxID=375 RepID=A0ABV2RYQ3_BRAJP